MVDSAAWLEAENIWTSLSLTQATMDLKVDRNDCISQKPSLEQTLDMVRDRVKNLLTKQEYSNPCGRILIALAGVPGSGKSTVSNAMLRALLEHGIEDIAVLPMVCSRCHGRNLLPGANNGRMDFIIPKPHSRASRIHNTHSGEEAHRSRLTPKPCFPSSRF